MGAAQFGSSFFMITGFHGTHVTIGVIFLITGLLGFGLGAVLSRYLALPNGPQVIATAFAGTGNVST